MTAEPHTEATTVLTPVMLRNGRWYKREDLHRLPSGVNGSKLRACQHLIGQAVSAGATSVISAASVHYPQSAMAAAVAAQLGVDCHVIVGGTTAEKAAKHPAIRLALDQGAQLHAVQVGYNPYLQRAARQLAAETPDSYHLQYGITTAPDATDEQLREFATIGGAQVANLPPEVETLVLPFGSGNTAAGVLYGLARLPLSRVPRRLVLVGIGPDRRAWLRERLARVGVIARYTDWLDLHGTGWASYGQKMPGTADGITLHPTYEGKVVRYLDETAPAWWTARDGTTCLWIVGGPLPAPRRSAMARRG